MLILFINIQVIHSLPHYLIIINPLNAELNPIRHLLTLAGADHFVHVSRVRVNHINTSKSF